MKFVIIYIFVFFHTFSFFFAKTIFVFKSDRSISSRLKGSIVGEILSHQISQVSKEIPLTYYNTRDKIIIAKVLERNLVKPKDMLYIARIVSPEKELYDSNSNYAIFLGIGEVVSVFSTFLQGNMMRIKANVSGLKKGDILVVGSWPELLMQAKEMNTLSKKAFGLKDIPEAIYYFKKSLNIADNIPETYMQGIYIYQYLNKEIYKNSIYNYIQKAWEYKNRFTETNFLFELVPLYIASQLDMIDKKVSSTVFHQIQNYIHLMKEIRDFPLVLENSYSYSIKEDIRKQVQTFGIQNYEYHYSVAKVYEKIYELLDRESRNQVIEKLSKVEKEVILAKIPIYYPRSLQYNKKIIEPNKLWHVAYLEAAIEQYSIAHHLDPLNTESAFQIIQLCKTNIENAVSPLYKRKYSALIEYFSHEFLLYSTEEDTRRDIIEQ